MKRLLGWMVASCILALAGSYAWTHMQHGATVPRTEQAAVAEPTYAEAQEAQKTVNVTGPLADYMVRMKPGNVGTLQPTVYKATPSNHVGGSPVGTSNEILHQTFGVAGVVSLLFEVPAHAATPHLRGTYRSFVKQAGTESRDATADVEFLLLNEQQYGDFLAGRASEAVFSAEDAHDQEVNTSLPPTINKPAKYDLVFRNNSHSGGKKFVQADFQLDF
jgi:hypothetical protein